MSKTVNNKNLPDEERFRVLADTEEPIEILGLRSEIFMWCERPFNEYPNEFLCVFEQLLMPIREQLDSYRTDTMEKFDFIKPATFLLPKTWLLRGRKDVGRSLFLRGATHPKAAANHALHFVYEPKESLYFDSNTPFLRQVTPYAELFYRPTDFLQTVRQCCDQLPFLCGHVGYSLELSPQFINQAQRAALPLAMRHPGVHISTYHATWPLRDELGAETVNWLTLLGEIPLAKLGGLAKLRFSLSDPGIELIETKHGLIIKAGERPQVGDCNSGDILPLYRSVYRALQPILDPVIKDFRPFNLGSASNDELTQAWLRRLGS